MQQKIETTMKIGVFNIVFQHLKGKGHGHPVESIVEEPPAPVQADCPAIRPRSPCQE